MKLQKATLQEITTGDPAEPVKAGDPPKPVPPIEVQFNPTSLKLTLTNQVEGNRSRGRQRRQYIGSSSAKLALQLVFDTADRGTSDAPISVRSLTEKITAFLVPKPAEGRRNQRRDRRTPAKVRFTWGDLIFDGIISQLTEEIDLFAPNGIPLRSKIDLTIDEQNSDYQFGRQGPAAADAEGAQRPEEPAPGAPGSTPTGKTNRSGLALAGEGLAGFLARQGLPPEAWRAIAGPVANPLSLAAGQLVDFHDALGAIAGIGAKGGPQARSAGAEGAAPDGFSFAAGGGLGTSLARAQVNAQAAAADASRAAFSAPGEGTPAAGAAAAQSGAAAPSARGSSATPVAPQPDPRGFGRGIPLQSRTSGAASARRVSLGAGRLAARPVLSEQAPVTRDPTIPGWEALPMRSSSGATSTAGGCGCSGGCGCAKGCR